MNDCSTCRWRPEHWKQDLHHRDRLLGDCRAPVPFWLADAVNSLAAPIGADPDDYRTLTRPRDSENITGLWAGDFPGCDAWEPRRMRKRKGKPKNRRE
jgi:hypothetical protein